MVFEEHVPEITLLRDLPVRAGATGYRREDTAAREPLAVRKVDGATATIATAAGDTELVGVEETGRQAIASQEGQTDVCVLVGRLRTHGVTAGSRPVRDQLGATGSR